MSKKAVDAASWAICGKMLGAILVGLVTATASPLAPSLAQHSSGHSGGGPGGGSHSAAGKHTSGGHDSDGHDSGAHGGRKGESGTGASSSGAGRGRRGTGVEDKVLRPGQASVPRDDRTGRSRPVWAGGTIPEELELGRLNVARAPDKVLKTAIDETYATNLDKNADGVLDNDADFSVIDSPRANLALYREAVSGTRRVAGVWTLTQAAEFLGKAADKRIAITEGTVAALDLILEVTPSYAAFSYDRAATYPDELAAVFDGDGYSGTGINAFAQAADDVRAIALYKHDNR